MPLFCVATAFISITFVLNLRRKRNLLNTSVLKESNEKLEDLIWLLKNAIQMLENPDFRRTGTFFNNAINDSGDELQNHNKALISKANQVDAVMGQDFVDIDKQVRLKK